ncbi:MAG: hypothetical protein IPK12_22020 [Gemmatimonadetes bacterium]|nr:hypothetical protein [Gemmatimonadota bacterium]
MRLRWGRLLAGAVVAELVPLLLLVALVALFGPSDEAQAQAYAARLGRWVGPIAGAVMCFVLVSWVARSDRPLALWYGVILGALTAAIDLGLLAASGVAFEWLFAVSNAGRVLAGALGGAVVTRPAQVAH